jgi:hypothetical protein
MRSAPCLPGGLTARTVAQAVRPVEVNFGGQIGICEFLSVGEAEIIRTIQIVSHSLQTSSDRSRFTSLYEGPPSRLSTLGAHHSRVVSHVEGHVGNVHELVGEIGCAHGDQLRNNQHNSAATNVSPLHKRRSGRSH